MSSNSLQRVRERLQQDAAFRERFLSSPRAALRGYDLSDQEQRELILPNFGWLIERQLAGSSRPRTEDALTLLREAGVRALVSLTEQPLPADVLGALDLQTVRIPVADFSAPTPRQMEEAVAAIEQFLAAGRPTVVHCGAGLGRTGTILAAYLTAHGFSAEDAIVHVRNRRPGSIETPRQAEAVVAYARRHTAS